MNTIRFVTSIAILLVFNALAIRPNVNADEFIPLNTQPNGEGPLSPQDALKRLSVPEGFQITLAAAEPDVQQPIAIALDDRGRLWVAESYSYNGSTFTDERHDRILIFEDSTGDGVFDRRIVFRDGLTHLTGLQIGYGGVWVTAPPTLSFIPDLNQDDIPDGDDIVHLDGWSLKAEHNSVNGLTWGIDGWLYGRHGIKQPSLVGRPGDPEEKRIELSCSIWRYHPVHHTFEVVADGTINPWGLDFDDHGQGFLTTSVVDHLWHLVPGAHYERWKDRGVHPDPVVYEAMTSTSDHLHWSSGTPKLPSPSANSTLDFGGGHSHCDAMIYLGDRWPERYRGSLFTSNIHGRRINRDRLESDAGEYRGVHDDDFLLSSDPWFRAVSMEYGPDGDVYLTDWSDNGECHDRDGIHRTSGRIYKITWGEPITVAVDLSKSSSEQLVAYQLHPNDWFVRHARRILAERSAASQDLTAANSQLQSLFDEHPDVSRKLRAMWALYSTNGIDRDWLIKQLDHENEHIRGWAIRLLVDDRNPDAEVRQRFAEIAKSDSSWIVRMSLASALQRLALGQRWEIAIHLAAESNRTSSPTSSPNLERMIWYAMEPEVASNPLRAVQVMQTTSPRIRRWIARRVTEASDTSLAALFAEISLIQQPQALGDLLEGFNEGLPSAKLERIPLTVKEILGNMIDHQDVRVYLAATSAAAAVGEAGTLQRLRLLLHDTQVDLQKRNAILTGFARRKPSGFANDLQQLLESDELVHPALQAAAGVNDLSLHQSIVNKFGVFSKRDRVAAIDCLVARVSSVKTLLEALEQRKIPTSELSAEQARKIVTLGDEQITRRLEKVWGSARPSTADKLQIIKAWTRELDPSRIAKANLENGHQVFQKACGNCHKLFGQGQTIGPDLTGANRKSLSYLLSNVIDPSAVVPVDFQLTNLLTTDGRIISGVVSQKFDSSVTIQTSTESIQVKSEEIETIKISPLSMMPEGLLDKLDQQQVRDLFAWMMSDGL